jgi:light-regulated signal transduction histidine kinase (bacteriophytochrome)
MQEKDKDKYSFRLGALVNCCGDKAMIRQVWLNLISNAVKYTSQETQPLIEIGCKENVSGTPVYFIRDNGVGFDMKYADKLFGVFNRLHDSKSFEGTGIGLAFAKRIINKHKGDIWAAAVPGEGAVFYFSLPATAATEE